MKNKTKEPTNPLTNPRIIELLYDCEQTFKRLRITKDLAVVDEIIYVVRQLRETIEELGAEQ